MLGHNWTCDLCGYTQWSATLNAPGSDSYSSGGSIYSGTDSYSSGNILGNYTPEMPMTYSLGHKETQLDILTPKIIEELKKAKNSQRIWKK